MPAKQQNWRLNYMAKINNFYSLLNEVNNCLSWVNLWLIKYSV
jgi:hypothetical protein